MLYNYDFKPTGYSISMGDLHFFSPRSGTTIAIPDTSLVSCYIIKENNNDTITLFNNQKFPPCICRIEWNGRDENNLKVEEGFYYIYVIARSIFSKTLELYFKGKTKFLIP